MDRPLVRTEDYLDQEVEEVGEGGLGVIGLVDA